MKPPAGPLRFLHSWQTRRSEEQAPVPPPSLCALITTVSREGGWLSHFQYEPQFSIISSFKQGFSEHVCSPIPMILYFQLGHNHTFQQTMKSPDK